jgi:hypothetical protein
LRESLSKTKDFREGALEEPLDAATDQCGRVQALGGEVSQRFGKKLMVPTVRAIDAIFGSQRNTGPNGTALLTDAGVCGAVDKALAGEFKSGLFERTDEVELAQHRIEEHGIGALPVRCR